MTLDERAALIEAVGKWAATHPAGDTVSIRILGRGGFSPRQVAAEMKEGTAVGTLLLDVLGNAVQETSLDEVLRGFGTGMAMSRSVGHGD